MNAKWFLYMIFILSGLSVRTSAQQDENFFFYSADDIKNIKSSSRLPWGMKILDRFRQTVDGRRKHSLTVPVLEGGHGHHYFCPVHNTQFVFDWESPKGHYCELCGKKWSGVDKYDWAWVNFVHGENLKYLMANMYLYLATDKKEYAANIKEILLDLSYKYPGYIVHDRERKYTPGYSGKMFSQSLDEAVWAIDAARAYMVAAAEMSVAERRQIETGFLRPCAALLMESHDKGNWQVWHNGGIIALGVALKDDSIINVALNKPVLGYYDMMEKNVYADGWWNEGSVVYHFYPLRSLLLSAEALRCRDIDLYDEKLRNMFMSPVNLLYADLTFPSHNDGWYGTSLTSQCNLYEIMALRTGKPEYARLLRLCYDRVPRTSPEALINGMDLSGDIPAIHPESHLFPDLGVGVLRSGERTVVLKNGPYGGLHGHPDKLSVSIHDGKKEILPDLGTTAYGVPDCYAWYQKTIAHNTVTVDGRPQEHTTGIIRQFQTTRNGGRIEAETDSAYPGVKMNRSLSLDRKKLKDRFICRSGENHVFDYTLILRKPAITEGIRDTLPEYERISEVVRQDGKGTFTFITSGGVQVSVRVRSVSGYELFSGKAPGIPPTGTQEGEEVYPLIFRVKGKNMDIEAIWEFTK